MGYLFSICLLALSAKAPRVLLGLIAVILVAAYVAIQEPLRHAKEAVAQEEREQQKQRLHR